VARDRGKLDRRRQKQPLLAPGAKMEKSEREKKKGIISIMESWTAYGVGRKMVSFLRNISLAFRSVGLYLLL
jgi:hypothetical protein